MFDGHVHAHDVIQLPFGSVSVRIREVGGGRVLLTAPHSFVPSLRNLTCMMTQPSRNVNRHRDHLLDAGADEPP